ncbi:MAG: class I SAM-dependent methyltransferase [Dehalococcoidia bacterium]|nr:class I SAM-dependent methyltransferase [Dehalococcoidia bacterium]
MASRLDQKKKEAFAGQIVGVINGMALGMMTSVGHKTGLFDAMAGLRPSTSAQIAQKAGLNERYVREWLAAMVAGKIVEYAPAKGTYKLPPEHAASLTRAAGPDNLAVFVQDVMLLGTVEERILKCFRKGGGVPYSAYHGFQELQAQESGMVSDATLLQVTIPLFPGLAKRLQAGIDVADIGCGQGHAINLMAKAFPKSKFSGYDFSAEGIAAAGREAAAWGLSNASFEVKDAATMAAPRRFDLITAFDSIHDQAHPTQVLKAISRALRPAGTFLMVDIAASSNLADNLDHPLGPALYTFSCLHCMTVSLEQGGEGLGTMWGEQKARQMLAEAGFSRVEVKQVPGDILNSYYRATKG